MERTKNDSASQRQDLRDLQSAYVPDDFIPENLDLEESQGMSQQEQSNPAQESGIVQKPKERQNLIPKPVKVL